MPVRVRMGIHTREAVERGGDYFGATVNRAARLMAAGHDGQVLCSGVTAGIRAGCRVTQAPRVGPNARERSAEPVRYCSSGADATGAAHTIELRHVRITW